jgi:hypothetical protein
MILIFSRVESKEIMDIDMAVDMPPHQPSLVELIFYLKDTYSWSRLREKHTTFLFALLQVKTIDANTVSVEQQVEMLKAMFYLLDRKGIADWSSLIIEQLNPAIVKTVVTKVS